jgi:FHS family L-fucose permease-like MFS transporter
MISSIAGGALIPPLMGLVVDSTSIQTGFVVPILCVAYLLFVAIINNSNIFKNEQSYH